MGLMSRIPWWTKLGAKLVLSKLPLPYDFWRRVGLFRHGDMDDPNRAIRTYEKYHRMALAHHPLPAGFVSLELGPGDSILSGVAARAYGASRVWMVDAGFFADTSPETCQAAVRQLTSEGHSLPSIEQAKDLEAILRAFDINYLTEGTRSLTQIPDASVDFFWSQVVFEHVPASEFQQFMKELRRVCKPDAIGLHSIDYRDHLGGRLNNLRFSRDWWEGSFFRNAGFYTNRIRPREMIAMFNEAGFTSEILAEGRWPEMPIKRQQLAPEFQGLADEDFMVREIEVLLRPRDA